MKQVDTTPILDINASQGKVIFKDIFCFFGKMRDSLRDFWYSLSIPIRGICPSKRDISLDTFFLLSLSIWDSRDMRMSFFLPDMVTNEE